jgi:hypothetical protein
MSIEVLEADIPYTLATGTLVAHDQTDSKFNIDRIEVANNADRTVVSSGAMVTNITGSAGSAGSVQENAVVGNTEYSLLGTSRTSSGTQGLYFEYASGRHITFNASTKTITATGGFIGNLTGNVTGNCSGSAHYIDSGVGLYTSIRYKREWCEVWGNTWKKLTSAVAMETNSIGELGWHNTENGNGYYTVDVDAGTIQVLTAGTYRINAKLRLTGTPYGFWTMGIMKDNDIVAECPSMSGGGTNDKALGGECTLTVSVPKDTVFTLGYYGNIGTDELDDVVVFEIANWNSVSYLEVTKISN